jgi:Fe-S cluster biosynthesis and repair protein YggX
MPMINCTRCKRETEGFDKSPLPGPYAPEIETNSCPDCFQDWMGQEVMIINECRLDVAQPESQEKLNLEMARFLVLPSATPA